MEEIIEEVVDEDSGPLAKSSRIEVAPKKPSDSTKQQVWNKSIGVISKKSALANLVRSKKESNIESVKENSSDIVSTVDNKSSEEKSKSTSNATGLSLLADYSGSDSDSQ